jgi:outer membrane biogenesis lipoprotein LolB
MNKFLIASNKFFNKLLIANLLIFVGFCLAGCTTRTQGQAMQGESITVSQARLEYQNTIRFKEKNKAFYSQFKN